MELWWQQPWGKTSGLRRQIRVLTMPVGKPRTVDSICPGVSIFLRRTFRECSWRICRPLLMMLHEYKVLWHYSNNKTYNCVKAIHKITPQKLFNTNFNIELDAFLTRAQPFHVNVGVGMGIIRATKFFPLTTVRDNWLVREEEFVQDIIADWGDPGLVSWGELAATKRSLS